MSIKTEKIIHIGLDPELHRAFKVVCARNSQSIKDALVELIEFYISPEQIKLKSNESKD